MPITINWVEKPNKPAQISIIILFGVKFIVYYVDNIIIKTEWQLSMEDLQRTNGGKQWDDIKNYISSPQQNLTVNLARQGSYFRRKVWAELCKIPAGKTRTYSIVANNIESGARAVANACRDNAFPGIIPCHRVVAVSGLGGYMGQTSGPCLHLKQSLLANERANF